MVENLDVSWSCDAGSLPKGQKSIYDPTSGQFVVEHTGLRSLALELENYELGNFVSFSCRRDSSDTFTCDTIEQTSPSCADTGPSPDDIGNTYTFTGEITSRTTFIGTITDHSVWVGDPADDPGCPQCLVSYTFDARWYTDL